MIVVSRWVSVLRITIARPGLTAWSGNTGAAAQRAAASHLAVTRIYRTSIITLLRYIRVTARYMSVDEFDCSL